MKIDELMNDIGRPLMDEPAHFTSITGLAAGSASRFTGSRTQ